MKKQNSKSENYAFIDGQNLHLGTAEAKWKIDYKKFRIYLRDKYKVKEAYYFFGFVSEDQQELGSEYYSCLSDPGVKNKVIYKKKKTP